MAVKIDIEAAALGTVIAEIDFALRILGIAVFQLRKGVA